MSELPSARLLAIIAVDFEKAVRCQKPGCGHRVYAAVHVVQDDGRYLVLGVLASQNYTEASWH